MYAGGHPVLDKMTDEEFAKEKAKNMPEQGDRVQVKIAEGNEYEDITWGKAYDVVDEYSRHYVVRDDQFDRNAILKEHCEIVMEEVMFKEGDRVQIVVNGSIDYCSLEEWSLINQENEKGNIIELPGEADCDSSPLVQLDDGSTWYVPVKLLKNLDNPFEPEETKASVFVDTRGHTISEGVNPKLEIYQDTTLTEITRFTQNNKGFSVSFEDGKITLADWSNDPNATFYRPKSIEELLELMECVDKMNEFRDNRED